VDTKALVGAWFELVVIHHTDCGSTFLADPELRRDFAARGGFDEAELAWLPATDPAATVRADVNTLVTAPQISPERQDQRVRLQHDSGHHRHCR
jgi:carbonic anhydrase